MSSTVSRKLRARAGRGSSTVPSAATGSGGVSPPGQLRRTLVGRLTRPPGNDIRKPLTVIGREALHEIHG